VAFFARARVDTYPARR